VARPRTASDDDILRAAFRAIARIGPGRLTLADVARDAGISAAALVLRFGSKRALLLAAAKDAAGGDAYIFPALRQQHRSPLAALIGLGDCMAAFGDTPETVANNLAFWQNDLHDTEFHAHALAASRGMRAGIRALIRDAMAEGELMRGNPGSLAGAVQATLNGSMVTWAVHRQGSLAAWLRRDLRAVLDPYRTPRGRRIIRPARQPR
jgi:AcrR family transcriptional regulator